MAKPKSKCYSSQEFLRQLSQFLREASSLDNVNDLDVKTKIELFKFWFMDNREQSTFEALEAQKRLEREEEEDDDPFGLGPLRD